jgi:hypothetical protein
MKNVCETLAIFERVKDENYKNVNVLALCLVLWQAEVSKAAPMKGREVQSIRWPDFLASHEITFLKKSSHFIEHLWGVWYNTNRYRNGRLAEPRKS